MSSSDRMPERRGLPRQRVPDGVQLRRRGGFSLIEVMVATAILVIIVLIMSQIFHQSTVAWDGGMRKAEGNMTARAALGLMAREIRDSVADPDLLTVKIPPNGNSIQIVTLTRDPREGGRVARQIEYDLDGNDVVRRVAMSDIRNYGEWTDRKEAVIAERVDQLRFVPSYSAGEGSLPNWVRIEMSVMRTDDVSGVGAESAGPNGTFGDGDDIRSF